MNGWQALLYFLSEAWTSLVRSWKISTLAVLTISVTLFASGLFLWLSQNVARTLEDWRRDAVIVAYLETGASEQDVARVLSQATEPAFVQQARRVSPAKAEERFRSLFPSLGDIVVEWQDEELPASVEISVDPEALTHQEYVAWRLALGEDESVLLVDDDQHWIEQLERSLTVAETVGWSLVVILFSAAIFTIASVVRLTAYLYREEISVMRLVGATEFFIRGPFYTEGVLQGLIGGLLALAGLSALHASLAGRGAQAALLGGFTAEFLSPLARLGLLGAGCLAGWLGAALSLRRGRRPKLSSET